MKDIFNALGGKKFVVWAILIVFFAFLKYNNINLTADQFNFLENITMTFMGSHMLTEISSLFKNKN